MYNSLEYVKNMEQAGFTRKQADATVTFVLETMDQHFATKQDFKDMNSRMEREFKDVRTEIEIESQKLRMEIMAIEQRMTLKLGAMIFASMTILLAALPHLIKNT